MSPATGWLTDWKRLPANFPARTLNEWPMSPRPQRKKYLMRRARNRRRLARFEWGRRVPKCAVHMRRRPDAVPDAASSADASSCTGSEAGKICSWQGQNVCAAAPCVGRRRRDVNVDRRRVRARILHVGIILEVRRWGRLGGHRRLCNGVSALGGLRLVHPSARGQLKWVVGDLRFRDSVTLLRMQQKQWWLGSDLWRG